MSSRQKCGEKAYGKKYEEALDEQQAKTWKNYAWLSSSVEMSRHRDILQFGHHQVVAPLESPEQEYWLDEAVARDKWRSPSPSPHAQDASDYLSRSLPQQTRDDFLHLLELFLEAPELLAGPIL